MKNLPFFNNIAELRKKQGLKQASLAFMLGVSESRMSQIEHGLHYPSLDLKKRLTQALQCDENDLMFGLNPQHRLLLNRALYLKSSDLDLVNCIVNIIIQARSNHV